MPGAGSGEATSPLGPSYVLLPVPGEDDEMLGRILLAPPEPGRSLDEVSRPNPCLDKLSPARSSNVMNEYLDAQDVSMGAGAKATLAGFGFSGQMSRATHFVYKLRTERKVSRSDTPEYEACCKEKGCGYGYISALIGGSGEYAAAREVSASGRVDFTLAGTDGALALNALSRRTVKGFLAAVITVTDAKSTATLGPLGALQAVGITESTVPESVKTIYDKEKLDIESGTGSLNYKFKDARGWLTENEFVRRYREVVGSRELDAYEHHRNAVGFWTGITLMPVGAAMGVGTVITFAKIFKNDSEHVKTPGWQGATAVVLGVGTVGSFVVGTTLLSVSPREGNFYEHDIPERQARLFVDRYNRVLLRKTVRDIEEGRKQSAGPRAPLPRRQAAPRPLPPGPALSPMFGAGTLGLQGSF